MSDKREEVLAAVKDVRLVSKNFEPQVGIILGSGLSHLGNAIQDPVNIEYESISNFPLSTVETHSGRLILGNLGGKRVVAMQGRFHFYEGYNGHQITFGVRVMKELGISTLIVSNACGGLNHNFEAGDLMLIRDHINLLGFNPLIGSNEESWGPRFPDMSEPYSNDLLDLGRRVAMDNQIPFQEGVYVSVAGPNLETRAEYRMLRQMGADVVGMSTVPEVIVARHMSIPVFAVSVVTDMCLPDNLQVAEFEDIIAVASAAEPKLTKLVTGLLEVV